jgi:hypothetical protein
MINEIKENTYRIKKGSYYYVQTQDWESKGKEDNYFENFTFPESVIETKKCECEEVDCSISVSNINLMYEILVTDTSNLVRVV